MGKIKKSGLLVVVFNNGDGGGIAEWFEFNNVAVCDIITSLKCIRKRLNAYWWGQYKIFLKSDNITLSQSTCAKPFYTGRFRKIKQLTTNT